jgi:hypothetical protein
MVRFVCPILLVLVSCTAFAADPAAVYQSDFSLGTSGFSIQWTGSGKLDLATDAAHPGPSGAPSLRTDCAQPSTGSTGVAIKVGAARNWRIRMMAGSTLTAGKASLNLQCWDAQNKQVAWIGVGGIPAGQQLRPLVTVVGIPAECDHLNMVILHEGAVGSTWIADVRIEPWDVALTPPAGPTQWGATGIFKGDDDRALDTALKLLACAGVVNTRAGVNWRVQEPERGKLDFSGLDRQLEQAASYGIKLPIVFIHGTPSWASGKQAPRDMLPERLAKGAWYADRAFWAPQDWKDWERYLEALFTHFRGRVPVWEILNEPDLWSEGFNGTYEEYCQYLKIAHEVAARVDPSCRIFTAAFVFGEWFPRLLADGMDRYFDGVCIHPYGGKPGDCVARAQRTALTLLANGLQDKEIAVTEVGYQSGGWKEGPGVLKDEETKAQFGRETLLGLTATSSIVTWYTAIEAGNMYGLLRLDKDRYVPMPVYYEYGDLTGRLPKGGGPLVVTVAAPTGDVKPGETAEVSLAVRNKSDHVLQATLWPVGFVTPLGPAGEVRAHDCVQALAPGESREIRVPITPQATAKGSYLVGLAALTSEGNALALAPVQVAP